MRTLRRQVAALHGDETHPWMLTGFVLVSLPITRFPLEAVSLLISSCRVVGMILGCEVLRRWAGARGRWNVLGLAPAGALLLLSAEPAQAQVWYGEPGEDWWHTAEAWDSALGATLTIEATLWNPWSGAPSISTWESLHDEAPVTTDPSMFDVPMAEESWLSPVEDPYAWESIELIWDVIDWPQGYMIVSRNAYVADDGTHWVQWQWLSDRFIDKQRMDEGWMTLAQYAELLVGGESWDIEPHAPPGEASDENDETELDLGEDWESDSACPLEVWQMLDILRYAGESCSWMEIVHSNVTREAIPDTTRVVLAGGLLAYLQGQVFSKPVKAKRAMTWGAIGGAFAIGGRVLSGVFRTNVYDEADACGVCGTEDTVYENYEPVVVVLPDNDSVARCVPWTDIYAAEAIDEAAGLDFLDDGDSGDPNIADEPIHTDYEGGGCNVEDINPWDIPDDDDDTDPPWPDEDHPMFPPPEDETAAPPSGTSWSGPSECESVEDCEPACSGWEGPTCTGGSCVYGCSDGPVECGSPIPPCGD